MARLSGTLNDSFFYSLLEQTENLGLALEQAKEEQDRIQSLFTDEIALNFGHDAAQRIAIAVNRKRAASTRSLSPRIITQVNNPITTTTTTPPANRIVSNSGGGPSNRSISRFSSMFHCSICLEEKATSSGVTLCDCSERFCVDCIRQMLGVVADEKGHLPVRCPTCPLELDMEKCLHLLKGTKWYASFAQLITEKLHHSNIRYCANERCGAPFDWTELKDVGNHPTRTQATCPLCNTKTCVECNVIWHEGETCAEYRNNERDVNAVGVLAAKNNWMPCPECNVLIEKNKGDCNYVRCRCGCGFCFNCGVRYVNTKATATNGHGTPGCDCGLFPEVRRGGNNGRRGRQIPPAIVVNAIHEANRREHGDGHHKHRRQGKKQRRHREPQRHVGDRNIRERRVLGDVAHRVRDHFHRVVNEEQARARDGGRRYRNHGQGRFVERRRDDPIIMEQLPVRQLNHHHQGREEFSDGTDSSVYSSSSSDMPIENDSVSSSDSDYSYDIDTSDNDSTQTCHGELIRRNRGVANRGAIV